MRNENLGKLEEVAEKLGGKLTLVGDHPYSTYGYVEFDDGYVFNFAIKDGRYNFSLRSLHAENWGSIYPSVYEKENNGLEEDITEISCAINKTSDVLSKEIKRRLIDKSQRTWEWMKDKKKSIDESNKKKEENRQILKDAGCREYRQNSDDLYFECDYGSIKLRTFTDSVILDTCSIPTNIVIEMLEILKTKQKAA